MKNQLPYKDQPCIEMTNVIFIYTCKYDFVAYQNASMFILYYERLYLNAYRFIKIASSITAVNQEICGNHYQFLK